ncbi:MAG: phosphatidate cytidylyltransferase [Mucilaginibacter sp.]
MKTRAITGFFFVIVMVASNLLGQYVFSAFYLVLSLFCLYEFYGLVKQQTAQPNIIMGLFNGVLLFVAFTLIAWANYYSLPDLHNHLGYTLLFIVPLTLSGIFITELFRNIENPFNNIAFTVIGITLTIVPFIFFQAIAYLHGDFNFHYPLAFLIMLWGNDTGAYLSGRYFGKHKLFERHSPKKTWEGFIGGVLISAGIALIISHFYVEMPWYQWVIMAVIIGTFGTMGDLVESMFKRSINVKDSGGILPGHGGLLDRFDGLFIAVPVVYTYLYLISN